jgi:hypothetical protein
LPEPSLAKELQEFVKLAIAPYKYGFGRTGCVVGVADE